MEQPRFLARQAAPGGALPTSGPKAPEPQQRPGGPAARRQRSRRNAGGAGHTARHGPCPVSTLRPGCGPKFRPREPASPGSAEASSGASSSGRGNKERPCLLSATVHRPSHGVGSVLCSRRASFWSRSEQRPRKPVDAACLPVVCSRVWGDRLSATSRGKEVASLWVYFWKVQLLLIRLVLLQASTWRSLQLKEGSYCLTWPII